MQEAAERADFVSLMFRKGISWKNGMEKYAPMCYDRGHTNDGEHANGEKHANDGEHINNDKP